MVQLGEWLKALAHHPSVWLPSWIAASLVQIAGMITPDTVDGSASDLQIMGNLDQPLLDQLPIGPATHCASPLRSSTPGRRRCEH